MKYSEHDLMFLLIWESSTFFFHDFIIKRDVLGDIIKC